MKLAANVLAWYMGLSENVRYALDLLIVALTFVVTGVAMMGSIAALAIYIHPIAGLLGFVAEFAAIAYFCDSGAD